MAINASVGEYNHHTSEQRKSVTKKRTLRTWSNPMHDDDDDDLAVIPYPSGDDDDDDGGLCLCNGWTAQV